MYSIRHLVYMQKILQVQTFINLRSPGFALGQNSETEASLSPDS